MLVNNQEKRTNWIEHRASRSEEKEDKKEWKDLWNIKIPSKVTIFFGGLPSNQFQQEMLDTTGRWRQPVGARYVEIKTPGDIRCWNAIWPGVYGYCKVRICCHLSMIHN
jgi:hypothetical protein